MLRINSKYSREPLELLLPLICLLTAAYFLFSCEEDTVVPCEKNGDSLQTETFRIPDVNFIRYQYFFLDSPNGPFIKPKVGEIEVFESVYEAERTNERHGRAFVDTTGRGTPIAAAHALSLAGQALPPHEEGYFRILEFDKDYTYLRELTGGSVIGIELTRRVDDLKALAVRYINEDEDSIGNYEEFPTSPPDTSLFMELIKPRRPRPDDPFGYTWVFMIRNIYYMGFSDLDFDPNTLEIDIEDTSNRSDRTKPEGEDVPYLRIFGLDCFNEAGLPEPDGKIDLMRDLVNLQRGLLIFPVLRSFDPPVDFVANWTRFDDEFIVPDDYAGLENPVIYDEWLSSTELQNAHKFDIVIRFRR